MGIMGKESSVDLWMCANVTVRIALRLGSGLTCHIHTSKHPFHILPIAHTPAVKWPLTLMSNDIFRPCGWIVVLVKGCFPYVTACGKKTAHMHVIILSVHFSVL